MLYIVEFLCALLFLVGIALFGVYALSKIAAALLAVALIGAFVWHEAPLKALLLPACGFALCALVAFGMSGHLPL